LNRGSPEQSGSRLAENEDMPLRQIFDDVCRTSSAAGQHLSFADLEAACINDVVAHNWCCTAANVFRRSRLCSKQQSLRTAIEDSDFCRGVWVTHAEDNGSALIFATNAQLELLSSATQMYFDATFKVMQTIFVSCLLCLSLR